MLCQPTRPSLACRGRRAVWKGDFFKLVFTGGIAALQDFPDGSVVKNPSAKVGDMSRGFDPWLGKIPPEEGMATHANILAWRIPWTEEPGRLSSTGSKSLT